MGLTSPYKFDANLVDSEISEVNPVTLRIIYRYRKIAVDHGSWKQTRRQLLKAALGGAAGIVLGTPVQRLAGAWAQQVPEGPGTVKLSDDLFIIRVPGEANVIAQT